jgi:Domain of unknown function (DUF4335)
MSYSVLRRYTPPTCALEILAKNSPLSRWAGQTVLKDVRFNLNLDDPKLPPEQWIALRGDRVQLEALRDAVQNYVQTLLDQSPDRQSLDRQSPDRLTATLAPQSTTVSVAPESGIALANAVGIALQPKGLLSHDLSLGSLQTETSGATVSLSTLQLFDLANALDEYSVDVLALPALPRPNWLVTSPAWAKIAAVSLLVVGVSASIVKVLDAPYSPTTASSPSSSQGASSTDQRIATQLPPPPTTASPTPLATSKPLMTPASPPIGTTTPISGLPENPGMPIMTVPQNSPVNPDAVATQPENTVVIPDTPRGGETVRKPEPSPPPAAIAQAPPSPERVDTLGNVNRSAPASGSVQGDAARASGAASTARAANPSVAKESPDDSAFNDIPQVAEAKRYFSSRWTPPKDFNQTLEYVVSVDAKGVVQSVSPLNGAATTYLSQAGMPQVGETLVSPLQGRSKASFRLVLNPDGSVLTFLAK